MNVVSVFAIDATDIENEITAFLLKHSYYREQNPTHQEEADEVNNAFARVLSKQNEYTSSQRKTERMRMFNLLYKNLRYGGEDAVDGYRIDIRQSLCFRILALLSPDQESYMYFLKYARFACEDMYHEVQYEQYILIDLEELLLTQIPYLNERTKSELPDDYNLYEEIFEYANENRENISDEFLSDLFMLQGLQK